MMELDLLKSLELDKELLLRLERGLVMLKLGQALKIVQALVWQLV
jgi:hypothetical protein